MAELAGCGEGVAVHRLLHVPAQAEGPRREGRDLARGLSGQRQPLRQAPHGARVSQLLLPRQALVDVDREPLRELPAAASTEQLQRSEPQLGAALAEEVRRALVPRAPVVVLLDEAGAAHHEPSTDREHAVALQSDHHHFVPNGVHERLEDVRVDTGVPELEAKRHLGGTQAVTPRAHGLVLRARGDGHGQPGGDDERESAAHRHAEDVGEGSSVTVTRSATTALSPLSSVTVSDTP